MAAIKIYRKCERCNGTGIITGYDLPPATCPDCEGASKMLFADSDELDERLSDILDRCNDVLDKCNDILEEVQT